MNKKSIITISITMLLIYALVSCGKTDIPKEKIILNNGAFLRYNNGAYELNNINNSQSVDIVNTEIIIVTYNSKSNNYLYLKEGKYFINNDGHILELSAQSIIHAEFSPNGEYLFYFTNEDLLKPMILDVKKNKVFEIKNKAVISGKYLDWIDNESLLFYGVDIENKFTGIYSYNIVTEEEEIVYRISNGYIDFFKNLDGQIFFHQIINDDMRRLMSIYNNEVKVISEEVSEIRDIVKIDDEYFFIGRTRDNVSSIYKFKEKNVKRVIYDFPNIIMIEKGLSVDSEGNLLFIGSNISYKEENIYKFKEGLVTKMTENIGEYYFIDIK